MLHFLFELPFKVNKAQQPEQLFQGSLCPPPAPGPPQPWCQRLREAQALSWPLVGLVFGTELPSVVKLAP